MKKSNADTFTVSLSLTHRGRSTGHKFTLIVKRKGNRFKYKYKGVYGYLQPMMRNRWQLAKAMYYYWFYPKARQTIQQYLRELVWTNTPDIFFNTVENANDGQI